MNDSLPKAIAQMQLSVEGVETIDALMQRSGLATRAELMNNMIMLFEWAVAQSEKGRVIASVDHASKQFTELSIAVLDEIAKRKR